MPGLLCSCWTLSLACPVWSMASWKSNQSDRTCCEIHTTSARGTSHTRHSISRFSQIHLAYIHSRHWRPILLKIGLGPFGAYLIASGGLSSQHIQHHILHLVSCSIWSQCYAWIGTTRISRWVNGLLVWRGTHRSQDTASSWNRYKAVHIIWSSSLQRTLKPPAFTFQIWKIHSWPNHPPHIYPQGCVAKWSCCVRWLYVCVLPKYKYCAYYFLE